MTKPVGPTVVSINERADQIVLKWHEGCRTRLRAGKFDPAAATETPDRTAHLARVRVTSNQLAADAAAVNALVATHPSWTVVPVFDRPEADLDAEQAEGERLSNEELADLSLYSYIIVPGSTARETARVIDQLNALPSVEFAEAQKIPVPASVDIAPATFNMQGNQGYLGGAPAGINPGPVWAHAGGGGNSNLWLHDIETGWHTDHEDFPGYNWQRGWNVGDLEHGTAEIGITSAPPNGYGVSGIAAWSTVNLYSVIQAIPPWDPAGTINLAGSNAIAGDVIMMPMHFPGPGVGACPASYSPGCVADCSQWGYVPVEWDQPTFDAIRSLTARGIVFVEAAGNGGQNLDAAIYNHAFDLSVRDSQAIMVGAIVGNGNMDTACFSNFGGRPDVSSWGGFDVTTLGYGNIRINGSDTRQWYTNSFSGTSSATGIVAGAAVAVNSALAVAGRPMEGSLSMLLLFQATGSNAGTVGRRVGRQPNMGAAVSARGL